MGIQMTHSPRTPSSPGHDPLAPALGRELRTERLVLRPATAADARATWEYRRLEAVNEWLTGAPADLEGFEAHFIEPERMSRTIIVALTPELGGDLIGDLMLRVEDAWAQLEVQEQARGTQAELGWVLDPSYAGSGYATEAVRELMRYTFDELGIRRIVANCFSENEASWRLMERVGMRRELHARRDSLHRSGEWLDNLGYAILRDEWAP